MTSAQFLSLLRNLLKNKIFWYLFSRYASFFIQFLASLFLAVRLGVYYFGVWSFFLLAVNIFQYLNFGVGNAVNVLIVQHKNEQELSESYIFNGNILTGLLVLLPLAGVLIQYTIGIPLVEKYEAGALFFMLIPIIALYHWDNYAVNIFRVRGRLLEVAIFQSAFPVISLILVFLAEGQRLLWLLACGWAGAYLLSALFFMRRKWIPFTGCFSPAGMREILRKGFFLFLYNVCFYFILASTRTIISRFYEVEEFGYFSFAYNVAQAAILVLESMIFLLFPKMLDMFSGNDRQVLADRLRFVNDTYITMVHGFGYLTIPCAYVLFLLIPQYRFSFEPFIFIILCLMIYKNSFAYGCCLMAKNQEKTLALISGCVLLFNIGAGLLLSCVFHVRMAFCMLGMLAAYFCYYSAVMLCTASKIGFGSMRERIGMILPVSLTLPFVSALFLAFVESAAILYVPLLLFLILNLNKMRKSLFYCIKLIKDPDMIDIRRT